MPLRWGGQMRKQWRYVALYGPEVMLCAARAQIGPLSQSFWAVWDREQGRRFAHTRMRPGGGEVRLDGERVEVSSREVKASLQLRESGAIEAVCPSGARGFGW